MINDRTFPIRNKFICSINTKINQIQSKTYSKYVQKFKNADIMYTPENPVLLYIVGSDRSK